VNWSTTYKNVELNVTLHHDESHGHTLDVRCATAPSAQALENLLIALRHASSRDELSRRGIQVGFRVEDLVTVEAELPPAEQPKAKDWLQRRLSRNASITIGPSADQARLTATFAPRGFLPTSQRKHYEREEGQIRVEAFELHVVEHCNLRCTHCCNMSPYVAERTLSVAEIERLCSVMAEQLRVDVFKIMGGEPLLHPEITEVIHAIRRSGISKTIRLFTNGLLLHKMNDDFWRALDELTISSYASAPVKPAQLDIAHAKAREFDFVLNVKPVSEFSEVMRAERVKDEATIRETYEKCWLRHRCLVVRGGRFTMCTRAAYAEEFHGTLLHDKHPEDRARALEGDGVLLSTPNLGQALLAYLNRSTPLASCRFCHGGNGPVAAHTQLSKADVREGRLRPLAVLR